MGTFKEIFVWIFIFMLVFSMCFISASEIQNQKSDKSFFSKILSWLKSIFEISDAPKLEGEQNLKPITLNEPEGISSDQESITQAGHNIPLMDYTCESIFPDEFIIDHMEQKSISIRDNSQYKNGVKFVGFCNMENYKGGNINKYHCSSGFFVYEDVLPDGTIIKEYNHVAYNFILDKRDCIEKVCSPIEMSCVVENFGPPGLGSSDYLDYHWQPIIILNDMSSCNDCRYTANAGSGNCYAVRLHNWICCNSGRGSWQHC